MSKEKNFMGIDAGSSYIKAVIINSEAEIVSSFITRSGEYLKKSISTAYERTLITANLSRENIDHVTATGFGRGRASLADSIKTEISAHAKGVHHYFPKKVTIVDIGGQDTKVIKINALGKIQSFKMNRKCAAGTGSFLEEIAYKLNIPLREMNKFASKSSNETALNSFCTVFASTEILTRIKEGEKVEDMIKSAFESVARRIIEMDPLRDTVVITGGVIAYNKILLKIISKYAGSKIFIPPDPQLSGAIGAALFARDSELNSMKKPLD